MHFFNIYPITKPKGTPKIIPTMVQINLLFFIDFFIFSKNTKRKHMQKGQYIKYIKVIGRNPVAFFCIPLRDQLKT